MNLAGYFFFGGGGAAVHDGQLLPFQLLITRYCTPW
jgi:hypothetical protein